MQPVKERHSIMAIRYYALSGLRSFFISLSQGVALCWCITPLQGLECETTALKGRYMLTMGAAHRDEYGPSAQHKGNSI